MFYCDKMQVLSKNTLHLKGAKYGVKQECKTYCII